MHNHTIETISQRIHMLFPETNGNNKVENLAQTILEVFNILDSKGLLTVTLVNKILSKDAFLKISSSAPGGKEKEFLYFPADDNVESHPFAHAIKKLTVTNIDDGIYKILTDKYVQKNSEDVDFSSTADRLIDCMRWPPLLDEQKKKKRPSKRTPVFYLTAAFYNYISSKNINFEEFKKCWHLLSTLEIDISYVKDVYLNKSGRFNLNEFVDFLETLEALKINAKQRNFYVSIYAALASIVLSKKTDVSSSKLATLKAKFAHKEGVPTDDSQMLTNNTILLPEIVEQSNEATNSRKGKEQWIPHEQDTNENSTVAVEALSTVKSCDIKEDFPLVDDEKIDDLGEIIAKLQDDNAYVYYPGQVNTSIMCIDFLSIYPNIIWLMENNIWHNIKEEFADKRFYLTWADAKFIAYYNQYNGIDACKNLIKRFDNYFTHPVYAAHLNTTALIVKFVEEISHYSIFTADGSLHDISVTITGELLQVLAHVLEIQGRSSPGVIEGNFFLDHKLVLHWLCRHNSLDIGVVDFLYKKFQARHAQRDNYHNFCQQLNAIIYRKMDQEAESVDSVPSIGPVDEANSKKKDGVSKQSDNVRKALLLIKSDLSLFAHPAHNIEPEIDSFKLFSGYTASVAAIYSNASAWVKESIRGVLTPLFEKELSPSEAFILALGQSYANDGTSNDSFIPLIKEFIALFQDKELIALIDYLVSLPENEAKFLHDVIEILRKNELSTVQLYSFILQNSKDNPDWRTKKRVADLTFKYPAFRTMDLSELTVLTDYLAEDPNVDIDALLGHPSQFPIISQLSDLVRQKKHLMNVVSGTNTAVFTGDEYGRLKRAVAEGRQFSVENRYEQPNVMVLNRSQQTKSPSYGISYFNLCFYLTPENLCKIIEFIRNSPSAIDVKKLLSSIDEVLGKVFNEFSRWQKVNVKLLDVFTHPAILANLDYFINNMNYGNDFKIIYSAIASCQSNLESNAESNLALIAESNSVSTTGPTLNPELIPYLSEIIKLKSATILFYDANDFFEKFLPEQQLKPTSQQDLLAIQYLYNTISIFGKKMKCLSQQVIGDFFTKKTKTYARDIYLLVEELKRLNMLTQKFVPIIFDYLCKNPEQAHKMAHFLDEIRLLQEPSQRLYEEPWLRISFEFDKFKAIIEENKESATWLSQLLLPAEGIDRNTDTDSLAIYLKLALVNFFPYKLPLLANDHPAINNFISPFEGYTLRELHYLHRSDDFKGNFLSIIKYGNSMTRLACVSYLLEQIRQLTRDDSVYTDTSEAAIKKRNELLLLHDMMFEIVLNYPFEPSSNLLKKYIESELIYCDRDNNESWQMLLYYKYGRQPQFASFLHTFLAWTRDQWEAAVTSSMETQETIDMSDHDVLEENTVVTVGNASASLMDLDSPVGDRDIDMDGHELESKETTGSLLEEDSTNKTTSSIINMEEETFVEIDAWQYFIFMVSLCSYLEKPAYEAGSSSKLAYDRDYEVLRVMRTGLRNYSELKDLQKQPLVNLIHWPAQAVVVTEGVSEENIASLTKVNKLIPWQELYEISLGLPKCSQKQYLEMLGYLTDMANSSNAQNSSRQENSFESLPVVYPTNLQTVYQLIMQPELQAELIAKYGTGQVMPYEVFTSMQTEQELCACLAIDKNQELNKHPQSVSATVNEMKILLSIFGSSNTEALKILNLQIQSEPTAPIRDTSVQKRSYEEITPETGEEENYHTESNSDNEGAAPPQKRAKLHAQVGETATQVGTSLSIFGYISAANIQQHTQKNWAALEESLTENKILVGQTNNDFSLAPRQDDLDKGDEAEIVSYDGGQRGNNTEDNEQREQLDPESRDSATNAPFSCRR